MCHLSNMPHIPTVVPNMLPNISKSDSAVCLMFALFGAVLLVARLRPAVCALRRRRRSRRSPERLGWCVSCCLFFFPTHPFFFGVLGLLRGLLLDVKKAQLFYSELFSPVYSSSQCPTPK